MASTSSVPFHYRYDVFLSFRGKDTRNSFTDHLFMALVRAGLRIFRDNDEIHNGQELKPEIERAIKESRASIVVLSINYANSKWCLDELSLILDQRRNFNHFVLPVFYRVQPSYVRNKQQNFVIEGSKWREVDINRWKAALIEVSNLKGMVVSGSETDFIAEIVATVDSKLDLKLVSTPAHLTGMDTRANGINSWLKDEQSGVKFLAICGMGGSGKTTLAQYIYNSNKQNFEGSSFLGEIGNYKQSHGFLGLQIQLLTGILGGKNIHVSNVSEGTSKIEEALQTKRVLIVLDDIGENDELEALIGTNTIHTKSKIIITTRHLDIYAWFGSISRRCRVYELELMNDHESLEHLSCHAFGSKIPIKGFKEIAVRLARYCAGNPLALKVLGSSLFVGPEDPRERREIIDIWTSTLDSLISMKGNLPSKIQGILRRSFDSLPLDSHKELFLHIACFFVGKDEDYMVKILEHDWYAKSGMITLINRSLLTLSPSKKLMMHQLLQDMGRKIVHDESKDPSKRSRVWSSDEAYHVLTKGDGSETIEGLALDMRKLKRGTKQLALKTGSFSNMHKLKLLMLKDVQLTGAYKNFPELRWLYWERCPLKTIHAGILMSSLVAIHMNYGSLKSFEPPMVLDSLKILNFKSSHNLVSIRNLYRLPNLETLILWNCYSLTHVCRTIGGLESLDLLDLTGCKSLWKVILNKKYVNQQQRLKALLIGGGIQKQPLFSLPSSLKFLFLNDCGVKYNNDFPVLFSGCPFFYLNLGNSLFELLPNNIDLKMLRVLDLTCCPSLKSLLGLPSTLEELYIYSCESLEKISFQSSRFRLRQFGYGGCFKLSEIQGLFKLVSITNLNEADLGDMKWIKAYEDHEVDLVGDEITEGRVWHIQMLYEYGIRSTFLPGIKDQNMKSEYKSSSQFLSFHVPLCPKKCRIQGLNVTSLYRSSDEDGFIWILFAKVSNITRGLTWIYNPVVFCKPKVGEDVVWLSFWPIGNLLNTGDTINVSIIVGNELMVSGCGASLVYMDGEVEQVNCENHMNEEEVIGGDLSEFELTTGVYYLCRHDFFNSRTSDWLNKLLGETIHYDEPHGWRKSHPLQQLRASFRELKTYRGIRYKQEVVLKIDFCNPKHDKVKQKVLTVVADSVGVNSFDFNYITERRAKLTINGIVDPSRVCCKIEKIAPGVHVKIKHAENQRNPLTHLRRNLPYCN